MLSEANAKQVEPSLLRSRARAVLCHESWQAWLEKAAAAAAAAAAAVAAIDTISGGPSILNIGGRLSLGAESSSP